MQLKIKRGTTSSLATYTPLLGELVMNTTTGNLVIGDGVSVGGVVVNEFLNAKRWGAKGDGVTLDTSVVQAAVNYAASSGSGVVYFPGGNYVCTGLTVPSNVTLVGAGETATFLTFVPTSVSDNGLVFTNRAISYAMGGFMSLTIYNAGVFGATGVSTPILTAAFTRSQGWVFKDFRIRGVSGWVTNLQVGDCARGTINNFEIRGPYVGQSTDVGQAQDVGVLLKGERGVVDVSISNYKILGVRRGFQVGDFAEGFSLYSGEVNGAWEGLVCDSNPSKPGGFVDNNHFNCNYRGIRLERRRYITIGDNQFYRDNTYFEHGTTWVGVEATSCEAVKIGTVQTRIGLGLTSEHTGVSIIDSPDTQITSISDGGAAPLNKGLKVSASVIDASKGTYVETIHAEDLTTWVEFINAVNRFQLVKMNESGVVATVPILFTGTGADKGTIKLPNISTATPNYIEYNLTAATNRDLGARNHPPTYVISCTAGSGAYVINHYVTRTGAVTGDLISVYVTLIGGSQATVNLFDGVSTASPVSRFAQVAAAAGTNKLFKVELTYNGSGWAAKTIPLA